jgi:hypothetical protein
MKKGTTGYRYHKWTGREEKMIVGLYRKNKGYGLVEWAEEMGVTRASLECHIRFMKRKGRL